MNGEKKDFIKKHLSPDGKLIISDDLSEKQKKKFEYINSLGIDVSIVLKEKEEEEPFVLEESETYNDSDDVELLNENSSPINIIENDSPIDDLDDFF